MCARDDLTDAGKPHHLNRPVASLDRSVAELPGHIVAPTNGASIVS